MKFSAAVASLLLASASAFSPGDFSDGNVIDDPVRGTTLYLSNGLMGRAVAYSGEPVMAADGTKLADEYHVNCDGGAAFAKPDGGYYYVSNSEIGDYPAAFEGADAERTLFQDSLIGGAYSLEFNSNNDLIGYKKVLSNTGKNCHGGATPWNSWVSCEEHRQWGQCWQVDPAGVTAPRVTALTGTYNTPDFGNWEAFAWDGSYGYVTNDDAPADGLPQHRGAIVRYTPDATAKACLAAADDMGKWCALESGSVEYLKVTPSGENGGTFEWVSDITQSNPDEYAGSEGAHVEDGIFTFSTVVTRHLFRLNLDAGTYTKAAVPFEFEPDNLRILEGTVYLCTDGDHTPGDAVWGWDTTGAYRIFHEENHNYPAGVDFSPDNKIMFVSMYGEATYQFWRADGKGFDEAPDNITYEVMGGIDG